MLIAFLFPWETTCGRGREVWKSCLCKLYAKAKWFVTKSISVEHPFIHIQRQHSYFRFHKIIFISWRFGPFGTIFGIKPQTSQKILCALVLCCVWIRRLMSTEFHIQRCQQQQQQQHTFLHQSNKKNLCPFLWVRVCALCVCLFRINVDVDAKLSGICTSEFA